MSLGFCTTDKLVCVYCRCYYTLGLRAPQFGGYGNEPRLLVVSHWWNQDM